MDSFTTCLLYPFIDIPTNMLQAALNKVDLFVNCLYQDSRIGHLNSYEALHDRDFPDLLVVSLFFGTHSISFLCGVDCGW